MGSSVTPRQKAPHAHSIHVGPNNKYAFAPDLGIDKVLVFSFDEKTGAIAETKFDGAKLEPGSGPRHFGFHPSGKFAYVINELKQTVTAFRYRARRGRLQTLQTVSTVPHPVEGNSTAEVLVHPSGKFLYGSNRGHDTLAHFTIGDDGTLTIVGHYPTEATPRFFELDPSGRFVYSVGQSSGGLTAYRIDEASGALEVIGQHKVGESPLWITFIKQA